MVLDWKNEKNFALANGIREVEIFSKTEVHYTSENGLCESVIFRNFPQLYADEIRFKDCVFENCGDIHLFEGLFIGCKFRDIGTVFVTRSDITDSKFCDIKCDWDCFISAEDCRISHCSFENIELLEDAYICSGIGDVSADHCTFKNCSTDREDRELFYAEETVGKVFKKTKTYEMLDRRTCSGLNGISRKRSCN